MPKEQLQKELKEKVKAGIKPSDIKRLKKSKSADDINNHPPTPLLTDQLKLKQKEIESLRQQLEEKNTELKETTQQLDNSLSARVAGVKVFGQEHQKRTKAEQELNQTIEEASDELVKGDDKVSNLQTKLFTAQQEISKLKQELKLERIKRGTHPINNLPNSNNFSAKLDYLQYALYALLTVWFMLALNSAWKNNQND